MSRASEVEQLKKQLEDNGGTLTVPAMVEAAKDSEAYPQLYKLIWQPVQAQATAAATSYLAGLDLQQFREAVVQLRSQMQRLKGAIPPEEAVEAEAILTKAEDLAAAIDAEQ